jgi:2-polyprenyl-3-methyl-5-hydroxy-6-metoxy-1,4-benzoquinol methylase
MQNRGYAVDGIELSDEKRQMAQRRAGIDLLPTNLLEDVLSDEWYEKYDMVCMFHVLEHILNPRMLLERTLHVIKPGGRLLIVVPNYFERLKELSQAFNAFSYFRAHLSYFKPETLHFLLNQVELLDIQINGTQLYSLENAIHWLRSGTPFLTYSQIEMPNGLEWIGEYYKHTLEEDLVSDGLIAIGTKP